jgi:hypothetical protein
VNRVLGGLYLVLVYGAACRLGSQILYPQPIDEAAERTPLDLVYWMGWLPIFVLGATFDLTEAERIRGRLNDWLVANLNFL